MLNQNTKQSMQIVVLLFQLQSSGVVRNLCKKMALPLVTLPSSEPEVALRHINLRWPTHDIKVVLKNSTGVTDNLDLRDGAYIYWRLLSTAEVCFHISLHMFL